MKLDGEYTFDAPREEVWSSLLDPEVLASIMPGCDELELVDGVYNGILKVKVGPVQGKFNGKVELVDIDEPNSYRMHVDGKGQQGFVKAEAGVQLTEPEPGKTIMSYDADARVGGKIAAVGQRLVDASAKAIIKESLDGLNQTILARHQHSTQTAEAAARAERLTAEAQAAKQSGDEEAAQRAEEQAAKAAEAAQAAPTPVKQKTQAELAAAVAREVTNELVPKPVRYGLIAAVVVGLVVALVMVAS